MKIDLSGKRALVSGSSSGIGLAIARGLAESGAEVWLNSTTQERVEAAIASIRRDLPEAKLKSVVADLAAAAGAADVVDQVGDVDILVNNLGIAFQKSFLDLTDDDWEKIFSTNVMSAVRLTRGLLPKMTKKGWGRIVYISSESALNIPVDMIHYGMTKTALLAVSRGVAESVAGSGITVNAVLPGPTSTETLARRLAPLVESSGKSMEEVEAEFIQNERPTSLLKRFSSPEEVANMVVYVCSEQASATTGAALRVDGGVVQTIA